MKAAGFTLLEILIALAVFGFLLVGLGQTVKFGLTAWQQDARLSEGKTDLEAVDRSLRLVVENLLPGDDSGEAPINGAATALTGVSRMRVPGSGLQAVPIEAGLAVSGRRLVLRWRPYHHAAALRPVADAMETTLIDGVAQFSISYWRPPGTWVSQWHEPDLPMLIRFHLTPARSGAPRWPDIVVAPALSRP